MNFFRHDIPLIKKINYVINVIAKKINVNAMNVVKIKLINNNKRTNLISPIFMSLDDIQNNHF